MCAAPSRKPSAIRIAFIAPLMTPPGPPSAPFRNYQRLRRHHFPPFTAKALRLKVTATNGRKEARVYEIRCYAD
jgi:hypothetical protein